MERAYQQSNNGQGGFTVFYNTFFFIKCRNKIDKKKKKTIIISKEIKKKKNVYDVQNNYFPG